MMKYLINDMTK